MLPWRTKSCLYDRTIDHFTVFYRWHFIFSVLVSTGGLISRKSESENWQDNLEVGEIVQDGGAWCFGVTLWFRQLIFGKVLFEFGVSSLFYVVSPLV